MMGTRAHLNADEVDAFSIRARRWLKFRAGMKSGTKKRFWRKQRARDSLAMRRLIDRYV